jgi:gliding motility-associated-like protein
LNKRHNQITCSINNPQKDIHYTWNLDDGSIMTGSSIQHAYDIDNEVLKYTIYSKAKSSVGCSDSTFKIIDVTPFVPNVFSPNGDGINDLFMPGYNIKVFDRNGLPIFEGFLGWDGKYKGQLMDPDTYFYLLKYLDRNSNENTLKGFVTLVR